MERKYEFTSPQDRKNWQETIQTIKPFHRGLVPMLKKAILCKVPDFIIRSGSNQTLKLVFESSDRFAYDKVHGCKDMIKDAFNSTFPCEHVTLCQDVQVELLEEDLGDIEKPEDEKNTIPKSNHESKALLEQGFERQRKKLSLCESPVEKMLYAASIGRLLLIPQQKIGRYRVDFVFGALNVVVEVDGHEFHHTKEQREKDAQRERFFQSNGWTVVRFTGTEVYRDADKCIFELIDILKSIRNNHISKPFF